MVPNSSSLPCANWRSERTNYWSSSVHIALLAIGEAAIPGLAKLLHYGKRKCGEHAPPAFLFATVTASSPSQQASPPLPLSSNTRQSFKVPVSTASIANYVGNKHEVYTYDNTLEHKTDFDLEDTFCVNFRRMEYEEKRKKE